MEKTVFIHFPNVRPSKRLEKITKDGRMAHIGWFYVGNFCNIEHIDSGKCSIKKYSRFVSELYVSYSPNVWQIYATQNDTF